MFQLVHKEVSIPVTHVRLIGPRLVVARFNGTIHILSIQAVQQGVPVDWNFYSCCRPRLPSSAEELRWEAATQLRWSGICTARAHQQLITVLECCSGRIVSGGHDHMLRVSVYQNRKVRCVGENLIYSFTCLYAAVTCGLYGAGYVFWDYSSLPVCDRN